MPKKHKKMGSLGKYEIKNNNKHEKSYVKKCYILGKSTIFAPGQLKNSI